MIPPVEERIIKRQSANLQDCEDRKCSFLDGIICRADANAICPTLNIDDELTELIDSGMV